jgi:hypothetical protein
MTRNLSPQFGSAEYYGKVISGEHPPALFATAKELSDTHLLGDQYGGIHRVDKPNMWKFKSKEETLAFKEQNKPDLIEHIKERGYDWSKPATVHAIKNTSGVQNTGLLADGHHRLAAMVKHRPDEFMPIKTL